jgi:hypothetical protein
MADYYQVKNQNIFNPPANTSLGNATNQFDDVYIQNDLVLGNTTVTGATIVTPKVSTITYPGDDTAADPAGGQTITLTGSGFLAGASVLINGSAVGVVSVVSSTTITFTSPANATGSYVLYVINTDGGTAIAIPGIQYSGTPTWTTAAGSLGNVYETASFNQSVTATGDAPITYSLFSGSIPPGATFNSNGTITGTSQLLSSPTTYTFTVRATDAEAQDTNRSFSLTINPDVVTWASPANGTTYTSSTNSAISNVTLVATSAVGSGITYTANALPTGLSLTGANISGTPSVVANSSSLLTATANTTSESSAITINWVIGVSNDIFFEYNTLLIPGASTTFVDDASTNNFAVTINGDTKPNSMNPYSPGYYSNFFQAGAGYTSGNGLSVAANSAFAFGTGDFTVEFWTRPPAFGDGNSTAPTMVAVHNGATDSGWQLFWNGLAIGIRTYYSNVVYWNADMTPYLNQWSHIAYVRYNGTQKIYINGQEKCSTASVWNWTDNTVGIAQTAQYYTGNISNLRMIKGTALYTSNFTPPTGPLTAVSGTSLLTCQSNRFIDNSTNNFAITLVNSPTISSAQPFVPNNSYSTYGSGYFDGTGDYLNTPSSAALTASGDFTIEAWIYPVAGGTASGFVNTAGASTSGIFLGTFSSNLLMLKLGSDSGGFTVTDTVALPLNAWTHVAGVRIGNTLTLYKNGVSVGSTGSVNITAVNTVAVVGRYYSDYNGFYYNGYISDARLVVGTAVYTTTFTPPSAPLTAISGTSLLTLQNNQSVNNNVFLDNSSNNFLVTRNGNTTQGTFSPYGGNWSNYFDGSSTAYIQTPAGSTTAILGTAGGGITPTATFTIECWIYQIQRQTALVNPVLIGDQGVNGSLYWTFGPDSSGKLAFYHYTGTTLSATGNDTIPLNTWTHIAVSISSGLIKLFVNGNLQTITGTSTTGSQAGTFGYLLTGGFYTFSGGYSYIGNLSNLRIVKSALYSTTFTPSTTPLTPITNTGLLMSQSARFIDNSPNAFALTTGSTLSVQRFSPFNPSSVTPTSYSGYFDGTGDYLTTTASGTQATLTGNWTMEFWINSAQTSRADIFCPNYSYTSTGWFMISLGLTSTTSIEYYETGGGQRIIGTLTRNSTWQHIALTKSGSSIRLFVGGTQTGSTYTTSQTQWGATGNGFIIGNQADSAVYYNGYISNLRVVDGTALYTTTFTPPTSPLTAVSGTSLLTLQSPTFVDNSTNNCAITAFGNSQPSIQNPFGFTSATTEGYTVSTIGGSGYFDGTGDYLSYTGSLSLTGAFTVQGWFYNTTTTGTQRTLFVFNSVSGNGYGSLRADCDQANTQFNFSVNMSTNGSTWATTLSTNSAYNKNVWNHFAVTRDSSNAVKVFINGVQIASGTQAGTLYNTSTTNAIGCNNLPGAATNPFNGYISDLQLINGTAIYTSNFVPPSLPLTAVQNTSFLLNYTSGGIIDYTMMNNMETVGNAQLSTAVTKFGGSSVYFDGTGDYLSIPTSQQMNFGAGDFTVEAWVYPNSLGSYWFIISASGSGGFFFGFNDTDIVGYGYGRNGIAWDYRVAGSATAGVWQHVAVSRSGTSIRMFVNGTQIGTTQTNSTAYDLGVTSTTVGSQGNLGYLNGYIDDLRVTKGYARYTSNFTAPTSAFPIF